MCGLVAVITKQPNGFSKDLVDAYNALLYIDSLRGMDSTGSILIENDGDMSWNKEAVASPLFCQTSEHKAQLNAAFSRGRALVGHNRAATRGVVNDENAHPFTVDNRITLVHNGTLFGDHRKLANVDVDSHAIAHVIHEEGDDVEKAIKKINGAYALIWHDYKNSTLNFLRNEQRPLHYVEVNNGYLWASEANMLTWILARFPSLKPTDDGICMLEAGTLVTFDFSNRSWSVVSKKLDLKPPVETTYSGSTTYYGRHRHSFYGQDYDDEYAGDCTPVFGTRPTCDITPVSQQQSRHISRETKKDIERTSNAIILTAGAKVSTPRIILEEQRIARDAKIDLTVQAFSMDNDKMKQGEWVLATGLDYQTVAKDSPSGGYFLYGVLDSDPNYLVRVFLTPSVVETDILDVVLNTKKFRAPIGSRSYSAYHNAADGRGYAMLQSQAWQRVKDEESTKDIVNV